MNIFHEPGADDISRSQGIDAVVAGSPLSRTITLKLPHDKPIVLIVGPTNVGKTAVLSALIEYTKGIIRNDIPERHAVEWSAYTHFSDQSLSNATYKNQASDLLRDIQSRVKYIGSTNDYFVLNARQNGRPSFVLIEAPGEDYFSQDKRELFSPLYLRDLAYRSHKKVYLFVFSYNMYSHVGNKSGELQAAYDDAIADFIRDRLVLGRDRFLIIYTNIKNDPAIKTGVSEQEAALRAFSNDGPFKKTGEAYRNSPAKDKRIIPFYSGDFAIDSDTNAETRTQAPIEYPRELAESLFTAIRGKPWWKLLSFR